MSTIILLPTYNERDNVQTIIPEIFREVPDIKIMVVDDNSPDGTASVIESMMEQYPNLTIYKREKKQGLGVAYKSAIAKVLPDDSITQIITMDADGSHDPSYLPDMVNALRDHDLVIGSRYVSGGGIENWEKWRYLLSKYGNLYANLLTGLRARDLTAGFVGFKKHVVPKMKFDDLAASGYAYQIEFKFHAVHHGGARVKEVPIVFRSRREGESKISRHIIREGVKTPIRLFFTRFTSF